MLYNVTYEEEGKKHKIIVPAYVIEQVKEDKSIKVLEYKETNYIGDIVNHARHVNKECNNPYKKNHLSHHIWEEARNEHKVINILSSLFGID